MLHSDKCLKATAALDVEREAGYPLSLAHGSPLDGSMSAEMDPLSSVGGRGPSLSPPSENNFVLLPGLSSKHTEQTGLGLV